MTVTGAKAILRRYPAVDGLTAETTTQEGHIENLVAEEASYVSRKDKIGI